MPAKKEQEEKPVSLLDHLASLRPSIEAELLGDEPDLIKVALSNISRAIKLLEDNRDTLRRLERPDA